MDSYQLRGITPPKKPSAINQTAIQDTYIKARYVADEHFIRDIKNCSKLILFYKDLIKINELADKR